MIHSSSLVSADIVVPSGSVIGPFCSIGLDADALPAPTFAGSVICRSHSVVYRGSSFGAGLHLSHGTLVREACTFGAKVSVGSHSIVEHHVVLGDGVRLHSRCFVPEYSILEDGVWLGPGVTVTNSKYPNQQDSKDRLEGVHLHRGATVGAAAVLLPGVEIGEDAMIGAGAVVIKDVPAGAVVVGNPGEKTVKRVPFLDLKRLHTSIQNDLDVALRRAIDNTEFVGGPSIQQFEQAFGAAHNTTPGAGCGSGTDALGLALRALGVGPGDEVIVPAMTFIATAEAVVHVGATPVVADVDPTTLLLTPETVDAVKTSATRAVMPVHLYGHIVPTAHLAAWRNEGLIVIEDAAQAHLGEQDGNKVGTVGHAACFSFYPGKNLGAFGDGGMVLSSNESLVAEVKRIRDHGRTTKYTHDIVGYCSRLDGLQAAILACKLHHLPRWTDGRVAVAEEYRRLLGDILIPWETGAVHHLLVARFDNRDELREQLSDVGVASGIHYPVPLSKQPWLADASVECPGAETAADEILSLPMDPLMPLADVTYVADQLQLELS